MIPESRRLLLGATATTQPGSRASDAVLGVRHWGGARGVMRLVSAIARRRGRPRRTGLALVAGLAMAGAFLLATGGGSKAGALARSRPKEPLPRLTGPAFAAPTHLRIVVGSYTPPFILDVDRGTVRSVSGLGLGSGTSQWSPRANLLTAVPGGALTAVWHNPCQHCGGYSVLYLIASDGSVRRLATVGASAGPVPVAARGAAAIWMVNRPRGGPCTLALVPSRQRGVRVPCGRVETQTQAGVWIATANRELIVNPLTGTTVASIALPPVNPASVATTVVYPLAGSLALESVGPHYGGQDGGRFDRLSLIDLRGGQRRNVVWPSYFGDILDVAAEPSGPLVAVDFGSPAYPGPAQAEDIWMLDTNTGKFTHLPGYPAQVDIKFSDIAWTSDNRLVIVAHGGGRAVLGIWRPGQARLPLRTLPARNGYWGFVLLAP